MLYMQKLIALGITSIFVLLPGAALAKTDVEVNINGNANVNAGGAQAGAHASATGTAKSTENKESKGNSTSSAAKIKNDTKQKTDQGKKEAKATTTGQGQSWGAGGIVGALKTLFNLGTTSSVKGVHASIRAQGAATTSTSQGLGFWARILGLFGVK